MTVDSIAHIPKKKSFLRRTFTTLKRERELWLIALFAMIWLAVFWYYPMYGLSISFLKYIPGKEIWQCEWVGLKYFIQFFKSPDVLFVFRNTLVISGLNILFGFPAPIILALLLNELRNLRFKKVVQTLSYLPHFISWVVVSSVIFTLCSSEGLFNELLQNVGFIEKPIPFLTHGPNFWKLITAANIWKGIGWSSILYLSAIAGIDPMLYQAGAVDGLNRFGMIWHITIPGIRTTIILLWILGIGGILNAGFEQQLLLGNPQTRTYYEVIDTYAYKYGIQMGRYSYGTAIGLFKSVIGLLLVFTTNRIAKKAFDTAIF